MSQPQGFVDPDHRDYVCKLERSLYGLKQAPRAYNQRFTKFLIQLGFNTSYAYPSLFVNTIDSLVVILLLYVDAIILTGTSDAIILTSISDFSTYY